MGKHNKVIGLLWLLVFCSCDQVSPPEAIGPTPSSRQLAWQHMEYYAFVHFNMNTFTDMEWGTGGESPTQFNPTQLDARQWAKVAKDAGMKGIIITAKHHDGFCLWPTATTEHSVKNSPWKNGEGDLLKDLSEACAEYGLKMGVYLSPWDRNNANYGTPEYVAIFHEQLRELLTNYGEIFEVWFDGANGGSGYYGGANETRTIDSHTYYQWNKAEAIVRKLQPNAVIFSDGGPDVRWIGNEEGWANETNWSIMRKDEIYPGWPRFVELRSGHEDGTDWLPAEADVSIRPGWYYHPREDHQVKSLAQLVKIYYESVGRNASLLLNLPVDKRGLVHENDVQRLLALKEHIEKDFAVDLANGEACTATDVRGNSEEYVAKNAVDGNPNTYWTPNNGVTRASITIAFKNPTAINRILLQEYIPLGQRVQHFIVDAEVDGKWHEIDGQTTIGYKRILQFNTVMASKVRVNILDAKGPPVLSNIELYKAPNFLAEPRITRNMKGMVRINIPDKKIRLYYTLDGKDPTTASNNYTGQFLVEGPATLKVLAIDPETGQSVISTKYFDINHKNWKVIRTSSGDELNLDQMIDGDPVTYWATDEKVKNPQEVVIDLGAVYELTGFTYSPIQERYPFGIITNYEFSTSLDDRTWRTSAKGEFANILNSRIEQEVRFKKVRARYIKLKGIKVDGKDFRTSFGEVGVITDKN